LARWSEQTCAADKEIVSTYHAVKQLHGPWEKNLFFLAKYYDSFVLTDQESSNGTSSDMHRGVVTGSLATASSIYAAGAVRNYGDALAYGSRYLFHSLPRMLTLWFNFGSAVQYKVAAGAEAQGRFRKMNSAMEKLCDRVPSYVWLSGLSQLKSRISHPNADLRATLCKIIERVIRSHPQQALWQLIMLYRSVQRKAFISPPINSATRGEDLRSLWADLGRFVEMLVQLCSYEPTAGSTITGQPPEKDKSVQFLLKRCPKPIRDLGQVGESLFIMPVLSSLIATFPASGRTEEQHNPFPKPLPLVCGVKDECKCLGSLARPKKITIRGTGGAHCKFLAKPKDDMRKDARMMEVMLVINKVLRHDPDASRRRLALRCYAVVPLSEEVGLIEWVPNTMTFRSIVNMLMGTGTLGPKIKDLKERFEREDHLKLYEENVRAFSPRVLHRWFLNQFPEPAEWFEARQAYTQTTAVYSMVGSVLGLGDRHGDNILLDCWTGEALHVDFNCLFWKGETFQVAEKVPYRLTGNVVDGMGVMGFDGVFRRVAEITMSLLRANSDTLMSTLEAFLFDPTIDWKSEMTKQQKLGGGGGGGIGKQQQQQPITTTTTTTTTSTSMDAEIRKQADITMKRIEGLLKGRRLERSVPLSVESAVNNTIEAASDPKNLADMYVGWAPWM
jgi:serine/threonine-protein kinase ATR